MTDREMLEITPQDRLNIEEDRLWHQAHLMANKRFATALNQLRRRYPADIKKCYLIIKKQSKRVAEIGRTK